VGVRGWGGGDGVGGAPHGQESGREADAARPPPRPPPPPASRPTPPQRAFFRPKPPITFRAAMARPHKPVLGPKKRGLLGFFESKGRKRGSSGPRKGVENRPKTRVPRVEERSKILPLARIFDQGPPRLSSRSKFASPLRQPRRLFRKTNWYLFDLLPYWLVVENRPKGRFLGKKPKKRSWPEWHDPLKGGKPPTRGDF
jgi:hypothetical protein